MVFIFLFMPLLFTFAYVFAHIQGSYPWLSLVHLHGPLDVLWGCIIYESPKALPSLYTASTFSILLLLIFPLFKL